MRAGPAVSFQRRAWYPWLLGVCWSWCVENAHPRPCNVQRPLCKASPTGSVVEHVDHVGQGTWQQSELEPKNIPAAAMCVHRRGQNMGFSSSAQRRQVTQHTSLTTDTWTSPTTTLKRLASVWFLLPLALIGARATRPHNNVTAKGHVCLGKLVQVTSLGLTHPGASHPVPPGSSAIAGFVLEHATRSSNLSVVVEVYQVRTLEKTRAFLKWAKPS